MRGMVLSKHDEVLYTVSEDGCLACWSFTPDEGGVVDGSGGSLAV